MDNRPEIGRYDLHITNASYERDNGRFECRVKEGGTGHDRHSQSYMLTVLTLPQQPRLAPGAYVTATEGKRQDLTCSSTGGSPDPTITWYREGMYSPTILVYIVFVRSLNNIIFHLHSSIEPIFDSISVTFILN